MSDAQPNRSDFDCEGKAMEGEPRFTLLARDRSAPMNIRLWAEIRKLQIKDGHKPISDLAQVDEALRVADAMELWRKENYGAWWGQYALPNPPRSLKERLPDPIKYAPEIAALPLTPEVVSEPLKNQE